MYAEYEQPESPKRDSETPTLLPLAPALLGHRKISLLGHRKISLRSFFISSACVHACVGTHVCARMCVNVSVQSAP